MKKHKGMKAQDVPVLLYIRQYFDGCFKVADLAAALKISQSEISESLNRSRLARLIGADKYVYRSALSEFVVHGLKYAFPVSPGAVTRGIPTAHSADPLKEKIVSGEESYVWSSAKGTMRGMSIEPLYPTLPDVCLKSPGYHQLLSLIDALRVGKVRESTLAAEMLHERISGNGE